MHEFARYLDRLGKLERYRRQIYALSLQPYEEAGIFLGLLTVIEWPKDLDEPVGPDLPAFERVQTLQISSPNMATFSLLRLAPLLLRRSC